MLDGTDLDSAVHRMHLVNGKEQSVHSHSSQALVSNVKALHTVTAAHSHIGAACRFTQACMIGVDSLNHFQWVMTVVAASWISHTVHCLPFAKLLRKNQS